MFAFITTLLITAAMMWVFFKFMYPKPPNHRYPQPNDIITPRLCDACGYPLAEYRGVIEPVSHLPDGMTTANAKQLRQQRDIAIKKGKHEQVAELDALIAQWEGQWFFCNYEHQAQFHQQQKQAD